MEIRINDQFMGVSEESKILTLRWKEKTSKLSNDLFKKEALKFVDIVKNGQNKRIIVDMRMFLYDLDQELIIWRNNNIISVYNDIGVEKFAFITHKPTVKQDDPANTFVTEYFNNEEEAQKWVST